MKGVALTQKVRTALANPPRQRRPTDIEALVQYVQQQRGGRRLPADRIIAVIAAMPDYRRVHVIALVWRQYTDSQVKTVPVHFNSQDDSHETRSSNREGGRPVR